MQTRKRAKSVSFGKKNKEKEPIKKAAEEEVATAAAPAEITTDKAEKPEEKETGAELSATPPKIEEEAANTTVETPSSEFVSDNPLSMSPELPKETKEHEPAAEIAKNGEAGAELSQPIEPSAQPASTPEQQEEPATSPELSSTPPPSAFTIQSDEQPAQVAATTTEAVPEKKRFGLYFLVVAFLSFVLGLGAMAGASYLGLVNVNLPAGVQVPGLIGQKPTPTAPPLPTATPTQQPVDLTAFTVAVLNGSGISGKAAEVKASLTTAGFKVTSTGNAANNSFTKTEIAAKKSVNHDFLTKLEDELNKSYNVDTTVATSPDSDSTDVTVTLGQPK